MGWLKKNHIAAIIVWLVLAVVAVVTLPNISTLVRQQGHVILPASSESTRANRLAREMSTEKNTNSIVVVYHKDGKLNADDQQQINRKVKVLDEHRNRYNVTRITSARDGQEVANQLISKNRQTELVTVNIKDTAEFDHQAQRVKRQLKVKGLQTYVTSDDLLSDEFSNTTEKGIQKTEIIAIIFIFVVLVLVFRSVIIPLVSLLTVGIAMIVSLSLVMNLAKYANFPISDFTQVFLVIILFGVGTDYNILLYDKFKEELGKGNQYQAINVVKQSAGRTIIYSGLSVFIGFAALSFAKFSFYQSAVSCSVGVLVLLAVLLTLNYFFMAVLGRKMFWPAKNFQIQQSSKVWHFLAQRGLHHPLLYMVILAGIAVTAMINTPHLLNYNSADEVPNSNSIKQGYLIAQRDFSKGKVSPTTIDIKLDHPLDNQKDLAAIDQITNTIKKNPNVKAVNSVTQPTGKPIKQLYVKDQLKTVLRGLDESQSGLTTIRSGLQDASDQIGRANIRESVKQVQELANGSQRLANANSQFNGGLNQYITGTNRYIQGTSQLTSGIGQLRVGVNPFATGIGQVTAASQQLNQQVATVNSQIQRLNQLINNQTSGSYATMSMQLSQGTGRLTSALTAINQQVPVLENGIDQLAAGGSQLDQAGSQLYAGGSTLASSSQQLGSGISQVNGGVQQLNQQLQGMAGQVSQLETGLNQAVNGLAKVQAGINQVQAYLGELKNSPAGNQLNIPRNELGNHQLVDSYNVYMSKNRHITQISVTLKDDPSSHAATQAVKQLTQDVKAQVKVTSLSKAQVAVGGQTSQIADLEKLSQSDFSRTAMIMIVGIGIALLIFTRSVLQPIVIITTLIGTYYTAIGLTAVIMRQLLHESMLTWNTPFFTFIMLIALGVDYSIFLMMRYRDEELVAPGNQVKHILQAATVIGAVVMSAIVILSGTFAALIPSGVMTLIQVAIAVIIGLIILLTVLPIIMAAYVKLTYDSAVNRGVGMKS
ncbi:MMPL family transporter [Limosilactobacillus caviae]|uniref:Membrane protein n=2 Tax=Bacteria TaxID=2 RepID=A0ABQ2C338_9LACO|nr:MMPL family transporter [Limosilactobacillus caviae]GGI62682.1 membrane protein [Limosilactobacillus caviae]